MMTITKIKFHRIDIFIFFRFLWRKRHFLLGFVHSIRKTKWSMWRHQGAILWVFLFSVCVECTQVEKYITTQVTPSPVSVSTLDVVFFSYMNTSDTILVYICIILFILLLYLFYVSREYLRSVSVCWTNLYWMIQERIKKYASLLQFIVRAISFERITLSSATMLLFKHTNNSQCTQNETRGKYKLYSGEL